MPNGNAVRSAIKPFIRWRAFILNVRSSELLLWNQGARGRRHPRLVPKSLSSLFGRTPHCTLPASLPPIRQEYSRSTDVSQILIPNSLDAVFLLDSSANNHHRKLREPQESHQPIGGEQSQGEHLVLLRYVSAGTRYACMLSRGATPGESRVCVKSNTCNHQNTITG